MNELTYLDAYLASHPVETKRGPGRYYANTVEAQTVCWACGGKHESYSCDLKRCFKCCEAGHEARECRSKMECRACFGTGHDRASKCYKTQYIQGLDSRLQTKMTCMDCGNVGHISCHRVQKRVILKPRFHSRRK